MSARVIYFGLDDCYRVPVLRAVGFEVRESDCLASLGLNFQQDQQIDAVIVSMDDRRNAEQAADMARENTLAPVILFCGRESPLKM